MFRNPIRYATAGAVCLMLILSASPAVAKPVNPHRNEGWISITSRTCGTAAGWQDNAHRHGSSARNGWLLPLRTVDVRCGVTTASARKPAAKATAKGWVHPLPNGKRAVGKPYVRGLCWHAPRYDENGEFSHYHEGVDLSVHSGMAIRAVAAGRIIQAGKRGGYGNAVEVRHSNGTTTLYAHASRIIRWKGTVRKGETIARVGSTGHSFGPHLHIEVKVHGKKVNPATFLRARGISVGC